ncbi:hypothetical protein FB451DRAFT_1472735 [Mycena latifolia]|nr:hypothetical protein FB451DRAFT_1472735 [Mycena latifolia]
MCDTYTQQRRPGQNPAGLREFTLRSRRIHRWHERIVATRRLRVRFTEYRGRGIGGGETGTLQMRTNIEPLDEEDAEREPLEEGYPMKPAGPPVFSLSPRSGGTGEGGGKDAQAAKQQETPWSSESAVVASRREGDVNPARGSLLLEGGVKAGYCGSVVAMHRSPLHINPPPFAPLQVCTSAAALPCKSFAIPPLAPQFRSMLPLRMNILNITGLDTGGAGDAPALSKFDTSDSEKNFAFAWKVMTNDLHSQAPIR